MTEDNFMIIRLYSPKKDKQAVRRVLREVSWLRDEGPEGLRAWDAWFRSGRAYVAELAGAPECYVTTMPGTLKFQDDELSLCCVTGVATSRVARKQGLAGRTTARAVAECAASTDLAALGVFEQGYYDRLGFGTGVYEFDVRFDPADLTVTRKPRVPVRITQNDWRDVHDARLRSLRCHGGATVIPPEFTLHRMTRSKNAFGLGYRDKKGRITHHFWCDASEPYAGPWRIMWVTYENYDQLLELIALMKGLGDQVRTLIMTQPPHVQLQDLIRRPGRSRIAREDSKHRTGIIAQAFWQVRVNDIPACLAKTHLRADALTFNLALTDPITAFLDKSSRWKGAAGNYVVTLGRKSSAVRGTKRSLPTLSASVNAFTRMWLGVLPATTLAATDDLSADAALLARLDNALVLPKPHLNWFF